MVANCCDELIGFGEECRACCDISQISSLGRDRARNWKDVWKEEKGQRHTPLCNLLSPYHTGLSARQHETEANEIRPLQPGLAGQRHTMHSRSLKLLPKSNSYGYVCSWYDSDGGAERQDRLTFS